ncbi:MAG TPA: hypothetical protein VNZ86_04765 [Bacteroidia bacterium]|jgi:hypothetical protein|nr:hypothetical protein [Bacteroidia bacterium]
MKSQIALFLFSFWISAYAAQNVSNPSLSNGNNAALSNNFSYVPHMPAPRSSPSNTPPALSNQSLSNAWSNQAMLNNIQGNWSPAPAGKTNVVAAVHPNQNRRTPVQQRVPVQAPQPQVLANANPIQIQQTNPFPQLQAGNQMDINDNNMGSNLNIPVSSSSGNGINLPSLSMPKLNLHVSAPSLSLHIHTHHHTFAGMHKTLKRINMRLLKLKDRHKKHSFAVALCWIP